MTRIVALHGFLGRPEDWQPLERALKKYNADLDFQTVDIFSASSGAKSVSNKSSMLSGWVKDFNRTQKNKHVERNILLGYSLGGRLALHAAIEKPGLWDEVVLISAHPGLMSDEERASRLKTDIDWSAKFLMLPWQEVIDLWNDQPVFVASQEPERDEKSYDRSTLARVLIDWSLANQKFDGESLVSLKPKLHWYAGEKDGKFLHLFKHLKNDGFIEDLNTVKNAGHRVIFDNPDDLARQLVDNLKL